MVLYIMLKDTTKEGKMKKMKAIKKEIAIETVRFCNRARIGFSAGGGTCRVLAGEAARFYGVPFIVALRAVNRVAERCDGFCDGAFFAPAGDAHGFGRYLARRANV
jgi:hypothetical protein